MMNWRHGGSPSGLVCAGLAGLALLLAAPASAATNAEIDQAIQDGLSWLASNQYPDGHFGTSYYLASTATAVLAFENEGHFPGGSTAYSTRVENGLDYLFSRCFKTGINPQTVGYGGRYDDPDSNGNGQGIYFNQSSYMYETGIVMQAVVASNTPGRLVTTGSCAGMTYHDVMVDVVDFLAWAQIDAGPGRGGWRYGIFNNASAYGDNSVAQWPVLGLVAAEQWGIHAPSFVKTELEYWVSYIQNSNGGSGYDVPSSFVNIAKTGGLLVEFFYLGDDATEPRVQHALNYVNSRWNVTPYGTWYGNKGHPYAMFSVFKGLELMDVPTIPSAPANPESIAGDWWGDYAEYLVNTQSGPGSWPGYVYWGPFLATPWYIVILQASVFPISVDIVVPDTACDVTGYDVSVNYSVERFEADGTLEVYRDGVLFDTVTLTAFRGSASVNYNIAPAALGMHTWKAVLQVTGGGITATAEDQDGGMIFETPEVTGIPDQYAPFQPFDLDDYVTCACDDIDWTVSGLPLGWTADIDPDNVVTISAPDGAVAPAELTFHATFHWPGIDCTGSDSAVFSPNQPPVAHPGKIYPAEKYQVVEGGSVQLDGTQSYDPDGDDITFAWDFNGDGVFETPGAQPSFDASGYDNPPDDEVYVYLQVCDVHGACDIAQAEVEILDAAPVASFVWAPEPQDEGSPVQFSDQSTSVVDLIVAWLWDFGGLGSSAVQNPSFTFGDNGSYTVCLQVTDDDGSAATACHAVSVQNVAPSLGPITAPMDPIEVNTEIAVSAPFTDPGTEDTHTGSCDWGDGTSSSLTVTETSGSGTVAGTHTYAEAGVYTLSCTVTDDDGGSDTEVFQYAVVFDPSAGFVTGGGWIDSPAGAYTPDPELTGKATFGFVSKYKKGQSTPTGSTEFQFHAGDLNFHSNSYDWLVIAGPKAMYKGVGTVNGAGNFGFMLTAIDERLTPSTDVDLFRIKIWDKDNADVVIYDNELGAALDENPTTQIGGGSIVIHKK